MKDFCDTRGIKLTVTTPYTPQHNGIVERINRMFMDKARTLMIDSGVPKELWAELINTANFLRVRIAENGKSPFEKLFHRKPNLSRIKRFGCRAFVTINSYKQKLDRRATKGVLVGYEPDSGVYCIFLEDGKIIRSRDVRFNKDEIPLKSHDNVTTKPTEMENTSEEEIRPVRQEEVNIEQNVPIQEDTRELLRIRLQIPRNEQEQSHGNTQVNEGANSRKN
ncbi:hypothetical protein O181_033456 [Austropuccinia psidii MF-1]|uniref:Integrase catalytic domain-containing protein n=1 Tax=Austropuccinia psidii MF-1 TaxID=1389203 RepID=A0A9Q3CYT2_9BASI|nr:hypothetical protein [Austropuccinia psidii MF-1]